jgi:hypothetical protein
MFVDLVLAFSEAKGSSVASSPSDSRASELGASPTGGTDLNLKGGTDLRGAIISAAAANPGSLDDDISDEIPFELSNSLEEEETEVEEDILGVGNEPLRRRYLNSRPRYLFSSFELGAPLSRMSPRALRGLSYIYSYEGGGRIEATFFLEIHAAYVSPIPGAIRRSRGSIQAVQLGSENGSNSESGTRIRNWGANDRVCLTRAEFPAKLGPGIVRGQDRSRP